MVGGLRNAYKTLEDALQLEKLCCKDKDDLIHVVFIIMTDEIRVSETEKMREAINEYRGIFKPQFFINILL